MDVVPGRLLDNRYRIGALIGRGGMATVHAATDVRLRRDVAVKLFHRSADEVGLARLEVEARLLAGLSHPGLLKVFDYRTDADQPYLIMQLVSGATLRAAINRGVLTPTEVAGLGARLADTLRYVHSRHVVHRDIKPSNVLLDENGVGYLADFGIAKAAGAAQLTSTGHCVGTAAYLAPEQVSGDQAGPAADIYSLGLVLLECLTGRPEFTGTEVEAALARLRRCPQVPQHVPLALRRVLTAMTARDPLDRPDAAACAAAFGDYLDGLSRRPAAATVVVPAVGPAGEPDAPSAVPTVVTEAASAAVPTVVTGAVTGDRVPTVITAGPDGGGRSTRYLPVPPVRRRSRISYAAAAIALLAGLGAGAVLWADDAPPALPAEQRTVDPGVAPVVAVVPETAAGNVVVPAPPPAAESSAADSPAVGKPAAERAPAEQGAGKPAKPRGKGANSGRAGDGDDG